MKIGTDPEYFLSKDEKIVPSCGLVGGTKENPRRIGTTCVHEDNVAIELTIDPSENEDDFVSSIKRSIEEAENEMKGYKLINKASHLFDANDLALLGASEFGCSSDIDAFSGKVNPTPNGNNTNLRSCGGHIHIDLPEKISRDSNSIRNVVLTLDIFLGLPSIVIDPDKLRRQLYGKASSFRPTRYGIEYRVLSNFWCYDENLIRFIFRNTEIALNKSESIMVDDEFASTVRKIINTSNIDEAKKIIERVKIPMP